MQTLRSHALLLNARQALKVVHHLVNQRGVAKGAEFLLFVAQALFAEFGREQHHIVHPKQALALEQQTVLQYVSCNSNGTKTASKTRCSSCKREQY
jgi:hypothetical protein